MLVIFCFSFAARCLDWAFFLDLRSRTDLDNPLSASSFVLARFAAIAAAAAFVSETSCLVRLAFMRKMVFESEVDFRLVLFAGVWVTGGLVFGVCLTGVALIALLALLAGLVVDEKAEYGPFFTVAFVAA